MKKYLFIASGGFIGAIMRFSFKGISFKGTFHMFPINTFIVNIIGSLLIGFFLKLKLPEEKSNVRTGITVGLLGAMTTFSTFCKEISNLFTQGLFFEAALYIVLSFTIGIFFVFIGNAAGEKINTTAKPGV